MKTAPTIPNQRFLYFQASNPGAISEACFSLTPKVSVFPSEVFLEIGCTEKSLGGETKVLFNAHRLIDAFQVKPSLVVTDRPEWARAFACGTDLIIPPGKSQERLLALPIERLTFCGDPTTSEDEEKERAKLTLFMRRVGMRTISDFSGLSPIAINRRFGRAGILLHEWVLGKREVVMPLFNPPERIREVIDTEEMSGVEALLTSLEPVLLRISARLYGRKLSAKSFLLSFSLESKESISKKLTLTEPKQDAAFFHRVFKECLASTTWGAPLQSLTIEVSESEPYRMGQLSLFSDAETKFSDLAEYVGRLRARLGEENVGFPAIHASYLPEFSWKNIWPPPRLQESYPSSSRPLFLFSPPKKWTPSSEWAFQISETVAAEWWDGAAPRKYFIAKNRGGERMWVFYDTKAREWFLHGSFD